jgi:hypothetical protein
MKTIETTKRNKQNSNKTKTKIKNNYANNKQTKIQIRKQNKIQNGYIWNNKKLHNQFS